MERLVEMRDTLVAASGSINLASSLQFAFSVTFGVTRILALVDDGESVVGAAVSFF